MSDSQSIFVSILLGLIAFNGFYYLLNPSTIYLDLVGTLVVFGLIFSLAILVTLDIDFFGTGVQLDPGIVKEICEVGMILGILFQVDIPIGPYFTLPVGTGMITNLTSHLIDIGGYSTFGWICSGMIVVAACTTGILSVVSQ